MSVTEFESNEIVSRTGVNSRIQDINGMFPVSVPNGGTGKTSLTSGQILLGNGTAGITSTATLPVSKGGTGGTTEHNARVNLGVLAPYVLYSNNNGTNGDITFSLPTGYELVDFKYLEFYFSNKANDGGGIPSDDGMCCSKIYRWNPSGSRFDNIINLEINAGTKTDKIYFKVMSTRYSIGTTNANKNKAIRNNNKSFTLSFDSGGTWGLSQGADIYVFKVIGYKN